MAATRAWRRRGRKGAATPCTGPRAAAPLQRHNRDSKSQGGGGAAAVLANAPVQSAAAASDTSPGGQRTSSGGARADMGEGGRRGGGRRRGEGERRGEREGAGGGRVGGQGRRGGGLGGRAVAGGGGTPGLSPRRLTNLLTPSRAGQNHDQRGPRPQRHPVHDHAAPSTHTWQKKKGKGGVKGTLFFLARWRAPSTRPPPPAPLPLGPELRAGATGRCAGIQLSANIPVIRACVHGGGGKHARGAPPAARPTRGGRGGLCRQGRDHPIGPPNPLPRAVPPRLASMGKRKLLAMEPRSSYTRVARGGTDCRHCPCWSPRGGVVPPAAAAAPGARSRPAHGWPLWPGQPAVGGGASAHGEPRQPGELFTIFPASARLARRR